MANCPICLRDIPLDGEAYTHPCLHRFCLRCIGAWTDAQLTHPRGGGGGGGGSGGGGGGGAGGAPAATCPSCRRPYTHIIYDANGVAFRWAAARGAAACVAPAAACGAVRAPPTPRAAAARAGRAPSAPRPRAARRRSAARCR